MLKVVLQISSARPKTWQTHLPVTYADLLSLDFVERRYGVGNLPKRMRALW
ncbi:hypothetical protein PL2TA16_04894 [Pseudoalteromonas luteoviolacea 2ta16]|uniref:Uncharacterized protein n=1 Tax=Pseudoalteromonas luteoviolacea (strain 2ta16) TaxID=1353533 RepID=V4HQK5_PSEL2|nr:hypothetical protein PL2TA16_04894 [Pseudoalteromonas luteoviolacea 2ta16]